ncbi:MAG: TIGR04255 family protein [Isosphaeraceae bacterium]
MESPPWEKPDQRVKFKNPPIHELSVGLFHLPISELKAQHIGVYWDIIRKRYPVCEQQTPIVSPSDNAPLGLFQDSPGEIFPLPRFWFSRDHCPTLIQVQRNAFLLNWRHLAGSEYPHYERVLHNFWQELEAYKTFIQETVEGKLDVIQRCELNYVNIITPNEVFAIPSQLPNILPMVASLYDVQRGNREVTGLNATVTYRVNPTLLVDLTIRLGHRADTKELAAGLELKAHGAPNDLSLDGARAWFDSAHDAIYSLFLDVTDKNVQNTIWRPI